MTLVAASLDAEALFAGLAVAVPWHAWSVTGDKQHFLPAAVIGVFGRRAAFEPLRDAEVLWRRREWWTRLAGRLLLAALTAMPAAACGSSTPPNPMMLYSAQEAFIGCITAPDPGTGIIRRDSQIGYYGGIYYNQSSGPVTMESVSLLHPHNLIFHGAAVYKMAHFKISLPYEWAWGKEGTAHSATQWAAIRQRIPGATIPPENGPIAPADFMRLNPDVYEIAVDMSAASPAGGWTPGVVVTYRAGGTTYTSTLMVGLAIGSAAKPLSSTCDAPTRSVQDYWDAH